MAELKVKATFDDKSLRAGLAQATSAASAAESAATAASKRESVARASIAADEAKAKVAYQQQYLAQRKAIAAAANADDKAAARDAVAAEQETLNALKGARREALAEQKRMEREARQAEAAANKAARAEAKAAMRAETQALKDELAERHRAEAAAKRAESDLAKQIKAARGKTKRASDDDDEESGLVGGLKVAAVLVALKKLTNVMMNVATAMESTRRAARGEVVAAREDQQDRLDALGKVGIDGHDAKMLSLASTQLGGNVRSQSQVDSFLADLGTKVQAGGGKLSANEVHKLLSSLQQAPGAAAALVGIGAQISGMDPSDDRTRKGQLDYMLAQPLAGDPGTTLDPVLKARRAAEAQLAGAGLFADPTTTIDSLYKDATGKALAIDAGTTKGFDGTGKTAQAALDNWGRARGIDGLGGNATDLPTITVRVENFPTSSIPTQQ
jgi:hypothetical protein